MKRGKVLQEEEQHHKRERRKGVPPTERKMCKYVGGNIGNCEAGGEVTYRTHSFILSKNRERGERDAEGSVADVGGEDKSINISE